MVIRAPLTGVRLVEFDHGSCPHSGSRTNVLSLSQIHCLAMQRVQTWKRIPQAGYIAAWLAARTLQMRRTARSGPRFNRKLVSLRTQQQDALYASILDLPFILLSAEVLYVDQFRPEIRRMPRDGCKECSRRRIKCDKSTPECAKCLKKGIQCTGVGHQIRFVEGAISKGKRKGHSISDLKSLATSLDRHMNDATVSTPQSETHAGPLQQDNDVVSPIHTIGDLESYATDDDVEEIGMDVHQRQNYQLTRVSSDEHTTALFNLNPGADLALVMQKPGILMLFDHCKTISLFFACLPGV